MDRWKELLVEKNKKLINEFYSEKSNEHLLMSIQCYIYNIISNKSEKMRYAKTQKGINQMYDFMLNIKKCSAELNERIIYVYDSKIEIQYQYDENDHIFSMTIDDFEIFTEQHNEYPLKLNDGDIKNIFKKLNIDAVTYSFLKLLTY